MDWKDDLKKFNTPHAKLLYMIYYFYKHNELSIEQKAKLKEYVILEEDNIFSILNEFESNLDAGRLLEQLCKIYSEEIKFSNNEISLFGNNSNKDSEKKNDNKHMPKGLSINTNKGFLNTAVNKNKIVRQDSKPPQILEDVI